MTDKIKHFAVCAAITIIAGYALAPAFGVTLAVTVGFWKELLDNRFDWWDMAANLAGALVGLTILS